MALADDLLSQAQHLASLEPRRPKQASLRRAISAAYYALFHLLVADGSRQMSPATPDALSQAVARAFSHGEMKGTCRLIGDGNFSKILLELQPSGFSTMLRAVAKFFVLLQEQRHLADYSLTATFGRADTVELIDRTQEIFTLWQQVRGTDEANVFLAALLFGGRWSK